VIVSKAEKHPERSGDSPLKGSYEAAQVPADDSRQRAYTGELNIYYDAVVAALHEIASIIIFGPGEAKVELKKRLVKRKLGARIAAVETAGRMTDRQLVAKVRSFFAGA
jgi:stalled ribosome rescue protein Dom34